MGAFILQYELSSHIMELSKITKVGLGENFSQEIKLEKRKYNKKQGN
jgi:hypothetical protein